MKHALVLGLSLLTGLGTSAVAQPSFTTCSAAFVGNKMLVDAYTPGGKCQLANNAKGELTVKTVNLSPKRVEGVDKLAFKVAVRDGATGTLHLFSDETYRQLPIERVLASCKKGDRIVLLTLDRQYALPHNEIQVR